jgi:hypothetical protein
MMIKLSFFMILPVSSIVLPNELKTQALENVRNNQWLYKLSNWFNLKPKNRRSAQMNPIQQRYLARV